MPGPLLRLSKLTKKYPAIPGSNRTGLVLFHELDLDVPAGESLAIIGESGSGKSTLLHLIAAMDRPTAGEVTVDGLTLSSLNPAAQAALRNRTIGYVWQAHHLLPEFTATENVAMPLLARGLPQAEAHTRALRWLTAVELADRAQHRAGELSGGEQQRVSLARALVTEPRLLLADEPTGNLDARTGELIFTLLQRLRAEHGTTLVLVTHNAAFARRCDRVLRLRNGQLQPLPTTA